MGQIEFRNINKSFGNVKVIEDLNLTIEDGKFTVLIGSSGCGKTTLLRMIAGIGPQSSGSILIDGRDISDVEPAKRDIAMVFQNYAIYPTMTVRENIEFGLKNRKVPKEERDKLIQDCGKTVAMLEYLSRKPGQLSGGQRQRIALARAMVKKPSVFLMDEPLSNLDAKLRASMRVELKELQRKLQTTFVYVTHDQMEAMSMADTIVLMEKGTIQQIGSPEEMYTNPCNAFVAKFIGTPPMNILKLPDNENYIGVRPERILLSDKAFDGDYISISGTVSTREMLGHETQYKVNLPCGSVMVRSSDFNYHSGDRIVANIAYEHVYFFDSKEVRVYDNDARYDTLMRLAGEMQQ